MWTPLITLIALALLALITAASTVALTAVDHRCGQRALTLVKLLLGGLLGAGGVFAAVVRLHQTGLL